MRNTFIKTLIECAEKDERIVLLVADLGYSVVEKFGEKFPRRYYNIGISEQNGVSMAAGMALSGKIVYFYSIIPFATMRCFEQIRVDVAYLNTNVRLVGVGAGLGYGPAGATHHAIEDISIMRSLPNMSVLCPGDPIETIALTRASATQQGPMYIRVGKGGEANIHASELTLKIGESIEMKPGKDLVIFSTSNMLESGMKLVEKLSNQGIAAGLVSFPTVKPLDIARVQSYIAKKVPIFTLEEHSLIGGLGSAVAEVVAESPTPTRFKRLALPDEYTHKIGSQNFLRAHFKMDVESLSNRVTMALKSWT